MIKYLNNSQLIGSAIGKEFDEFLESSGLLTEGMLKNANIRRHSKSNLVIMKPARTI